MHLKSVTLKGFKSFAQPTTFAFETGVTCIVGPNGSGKSNVVDALAWVMGEQGAKTLRGGKMEDVIFAGTATRGPLGRAEVQLTIDNADGALPIEYSEVTISRTLFRNGASEYAINGGVCRLLDVQELLSDSGLGREMHVIVGQGRLDSVLQASPEERRGFIEEAAGILKHRRRKEKTLRKLEAMEANLTRLSDLAGELRRQLKPLGRQAEIAREAATIAAVVRDARARLLADELAGLRSGARRSCAQRAGASHRATRAAGSVREPPHPHRAARRAAAIRRRRRGAQRSRTDSSGCRSGCAACSRSTGQRLALLGENADDEGIEITTVSQGDDRRRSAPRSTRSRQGWAMRRMPRPKHLATSCAPAPSSTRWTSTSPRRARSSRSTTCASPRCAGLPKPPHPPSPRCAPASSVSSSRSMPPSPAAQRRRRSSRGSIPNSCPRARPPSTPRRTSAPSARRPMPKRPSAGCASGCMPPSASVESLTAQTTALGRALDVRNAAAELVARGGSGIRGLLGDAVKVTPGYEAAIAAALGPLAEGVLVETRDDAFAVARTVPRQ